MSLGNGQVVEIILEDGLRYVRVACPPNLAPSAGQYVLASEGPGSLLPVPLFHTDSTPQGFVAALPASTAWAPGYTLHLRGPLGRGFNLPLSARRVGLVAFDNSPARLKGLVRLALKQASAVVLVCDSAPDSLPADVEVQPLSALSDILEWADYAAFDVTREHLSVFREQAANIGPLTSGMSVQVLVHTPVPCGGLAECGACAITRRGEWKLACKEGPVFDWKDLV